MIVSKNRQVNDAYFTPTDTVLDFLHVQDVLTKSMSILEPCCGNGQISRNLIASGYKDVTSSDLIDYGYEPAKTGVDFLKIRKNYDAIITNPPYKHATDMVNHALTLSPVVVMLLRLSYLEGIERARTVWKNTPLHRVYICSHRPSMYAVDHTGPRKGGFVAYAWYVWKQDSTERRIEWIVDVKRPEQVYCVKQRTDKQTTIRATWLDQPFTSDDQAIRHYTNKLPMNKAFEIWSGSRLVYSSLYNDLILTGGQHKLF